MIDPQVFRTSREVARLRLSPEEARNSFGYHIDIPNDWESYGCPEELVPFLGIHSTHIAHFQEIISDLGPLTKEEHNWVKRYVGFYENIAKLLSTTGARVELRYDIAETLFDWRSILKFAQLPCRVLDFGAGCGRQCVSAFLRDPANIYVAVDSTLAAYTLQNLAFSYLDTLYPEQHSFDLLDFEATTKPFPVIKDSPAGSRFHLPTWLAENHIPERFFDAILVCHVHNELSGPDFMRLMRVIEKGLAPEGIVYLRSEVTVIDPLDFFDAVDLHAIDPVKLLAEKGIVPVYSELKCAYLTTVFARKGSNHHQKALKSRSPEHSFSNTAKAMDLSTRAGENFVRHHFEGISKLNKNVAAIGDVTEFLQVKGYKKSLKLTMGRFFEKHVYSEDEILNPDNEFAQNQLAEYNPEIIVIASQQYGAIEEIIRKILPQREFTLRRYYWFPIVFLYEDSVVPKDGIFSDPILGQKDLVGRI